MTLIVTVLNTVYYFVMSFVVESSGAGALMEHLILPLVCGVIAMPLGLAFAAVGRRWSGFGGMTLMLMALIVAPFNFMLRFANKTVVQSPASELVWVDTQAPLPVGKAVTQTANGELLVASERIGVVNGNRVVLDGQGDIGEVNDDAVLGSNGDRIARIIAG